MLDDVPFMQLNLVVSELHLTPISDLVDCLLIFVGELKHVKGGVPTSTDITRHDACIKGEVI